MNGSKLRQVFWKPAPPTDPGGIASNVTLTLTSLFRREDYIQILGLRVCAATLDRTVESTNFVLVQVSLP